MARARASSASSHSNLGHVVAADGAGHHLVRRPRAPASLGIAADQRARRGEGLQTATAPAGAHGARLDRRWCGQAHLHDRPGRCRACRRAPPRHPPPCPASGAGSRHSRALRRAVPRPAPPRERRVSADTGTPTRSWTPGQWPRRASRGWPPRSQSPSPRRRSLEQRGRPGHRGRAQPTRSAAKPATASTTASGPSDDRRRARWRLPGCARRRRHP